MVKPATIAAKPYFVYIVRCADETLYTGIATNIAARIHQHNTSHLGAKYTRARRPVTVVYSKRYESRGAALREEARIKRLKRQDKQLLLSAP